MELSERETRYFVGRLISARTRLLCDHGFYGLLVMHASFALDENIGTAATDGDRIIFSPSFLRALSDGELDFVLMHEILHISLRHCERVGDRDRELFNIACDIVVNSEILREFGGDKRAITIAGFGTLMHTVDGKEGCEFTAEEVYERLLPLARDKRGRMRILSVGTIDDHSRWAHASQGDPDEFFANASSDDLDDVWANRISAAAESMGKRIECTGVGSLPLFVERFLDLLRGGKVDWRTALNDFVQENVCDYGFTPPDKRYEGDFFLPDFNDAEYIPSDILFMIDTSGSMSNEAVASVYSEVYSAIEQFDGKLNGLLGFFDSAVTEPRPFTSVEELLDYKPIGGGGTSFSAVFDYIKRRMADMPIKCIIILTDGGATFPNKEAALGIPVMWVICGTDVKPPWGSTVYI